MLGVNERCTFYALEHDVTLELRHIERCARPWWGYCTELELIVPETFCARVWYRRRQHQLAPGHMLCAVPGEVVKILHVARPGALHMLALGPGLYARLPIFAHLTPLRTAAWVTVTRALYGLESTGALMPALHTLLSSLQEGPCACASTGGARPQPSSCRCSMRELLAANRMPPLGGVRPGISRSQADRRFKQRHGLPPHAYALCVRVAQAKQQLRAGVSPAQVAAAQGFTDQSHFTRHFKRLVGFTPRQYLRAFSRRGGPPAAEERT
jgi:hypothetical protein